LSREVFKGFLKEMKKVKNEQKKREYSWKVEKKQVVTEAEENKNSLSFLQQMGQAIENIENSEKDRIDLKSKINKVHGKKNQGLPETDQSINWEVNHESLEQKRLSLREEELRLNLEKLRLIEEAKRIENEKQELEAKHIQRIKKKMSKKEDSLGNVILAVQAKPENKKKEGDDTTMLSGDAEEFSYSEPVNKLLLDEKKVGVGRLESRLISYLTVPNPCQKLD